VNWLAGISIYVALPLFALVFAGTGVLAHTLLRRVLPPPERLSEDHDVAGFLMGVVGVLYSVVLGFLVGTVWTAFASAQQTADFEAGYVADAFNYAGQMPAPQSRALQRVIARYALTVRAENWSVPQNRGADATGALLYDAVRLTFASASPPAATSGQALQANTIKTALVDSLKNIADMRRLRLVQSQSRLPAGLLEALLLGAVGVLAFTFLFGVRSYAKQMVLTALLAGSIGLFFGLILELSTPYSGAIHVSRDSLNFVIANNHLETFAR
jgi:hypothetical protein